MSHHFKIILTLLVVTAVSVSVGAQNFTDAMRYSMTEALGTSRNASVGGAMGALGADFGVLGINPAGTGAYRSSEFVITGAVFANTTNSELLDSGFPATKESGSRFVISNFGIVFAARPKKKDPRKRKEPKLKASNFALGYNKTGEYTQDFRFSGRVLGSITDRWAEQAFGIPWDQLDAFETGPAYSTGAIYDLEEDLTYETDYQLNPNAALLRRQDVKARGASSEIFISYGANLNEKFLFGATVGVPLVNYEEERIYEEEDDASDEVPFFNALRYEERLSTSGSGFNAKLGVIYKPVKWLNIGAAWNTGTRLSMTDNFSTLVRYDYTDGDRQVYESISPDGTFNYALKTPSSFVGNLGAVIKQSGFLTAQIEYKNFGNAKFDYSVKDNGNEFEDFERLVNDDIKENLGSAIKLSFGGEFAWKKLRVRAGAILDQSPFVDDSEFNTTWTAGLGVRFQRIFLDFGYQRIQTEQGYLPYATESAPQPFVVNDITNNRFFLTFGYKWL